MERIILEKEFKNKIILRDEEDGSGKICVSGGIYAINDVSVDILKSLNRTKNITVALRNIMEQYEISYEELVQDTKVFLKQLAQIHVISESLCDIYIEEIGINEKHGNI